MIANTVLISFYQFFIIFITGKMKLTIFIEVIKRFLE